MSTMAERLDKLIKDAIPIPPNGIFGVTGVSSFIIPIDNGFKAVVTGDEHEGDGSKIDDFQKNDPLYQTFQDHYFEQEYFKIDGGDNWDLWKFDSLSTVCKAHPGIEERREKFKEKGLYYKVDGNHDRVLSWPEMLILDHKSSGRKIIIVHLFQGDWMNDEGHEFAKFLVRNFWKHIEETGIEDPTTPDISTITAQPSNPKKHLEVLHNAKDWAKAHPEYDLVGGHIHFAEHSDDYPNYWNWGNWCASEIGGQAIEIEASKDKYTINLKFISQKGEQL